MLGVELKFVDLEVGEMIGQLQQRFDLRHAPARNIKHHAPPWKIGLIAYLQTGKPPTEFAEQLPQGRDACAKPILSHVAGLRHFKDDSFFGDGETIA